MSFNTDEDLLQEVMQNMHAIAAELREEGFDVQLGPSITLNSPKLTVNGQICGIDDTRYHFSLTPGCSKLMWPTIFEQCKAHNLRFYVEYDNLLLSNGSRNILDVKSIDKRDFDMHKLLEIAYAKSIRITLKHSNIDVFGRADYSDVMAIRKVMPRTGSIVIHVHDMKSDCLAWWEMLQGDSRIWLQTNFDTYKQYVKLINTISVKSEFIEEMIQAGYEDAL